MIGRLGFDRNRVLFPQSNRTPFHRREREDRDLPRTGWAVKWVVAWAALFTIVGALGADEPVRRAPTEPVGSPGPAAPPLSANGESRVEESKPPLYYLKDRQGNLQPVPGFTLEEFEELYKLKHELAQQESRPGFSIQRVSVVGSCSTDRAELAVQFTVQTRDDSWVRVPLRLDRGLLYEAVGYRGPGEYLLHFEPEGDGYVCWLRGGAKEPHEVTLRMFVPLQTNRDETRLRLAVPRAVASQMKLTVPIADAVARVSERSTLQQASPAGDSATEFTVLGLGADFEISWKHPDAQAAAPRPVLEASASILAQIDTAGVDYDAVLSVRSPTEPFDSFQVVLPPDCELLSSGNSGYTAAIAAGEASRSEGAPRRVEVRLNRKTTGPVEVRLAARRPPLSTRSDAWTELGGFEVVGAGRQWGTIAVTVMNDWQVLWGASRGVRPAEQTPESLRREDLAAVFEYFTQPFSLTARPAPKRTRIYVEPEYRVTVGNNEVNLDARLRYTLRGAKVFALEVGLTDWQLDDAGPDHLVATDGVDYDPATRLATIPLMQPSSGAIEIRLRAHKPLPPDAASVQWVLPQPKAHSSSPASVLISAAPPIELLPRPDQLEGLVREQVPSHFALSLPAEPVLFYRSEAGRAVFAADVRRHQRQMTAGVQTTIRVEQRSTRIDQVFSYQVAHDAVDQLRVAVPATVAGDDLMKFEYRGKPLSAAPDDLEPADENRPLRTYRLLLPGPMIGSFEVEAHYEISLPSVPAAKRLTATIPLVMPSVDRLTGNRLTVSSVREWSVDVLPGIWSAVPQIYSGTSGRRELSATCDSSAAVVELSLQPNPVSQSGDLIVERQWLQTWLTETSRQDRFVARFFTRSGQVELNIPKGAALGQLTLTLDGRAVNDPLLRQERIILPLSGPPGEPHVVEARYHFASPRPPRGAMSFELPSLGPDAWVRRAYWQLVLPDNEHVLKTPEGFCSEMTFERRAFFWQRQPVVAQADLERWSGASPRGPLPSAANCFLFGSFGSVTKTEVFTASRGTVFACASGAALAACFLLIYLPRGRMWMAMGLLAAATTAAMIAPEQALVAFQAALPGLLLGGIGYLLARKLDRQATPADPISYQTRIAPLDAVGGVQQPASTTTAPIAEPASAEP